MGPGFAEMEAIMATFVSTLLDADLTHGFQIRRHFKDATRAVHNVLDADAFCEFRQDESFVGQDLKNGLKQK